MTETSQGVNSVDIAVSILTFVASQNGQARAIDIATGCGLSKSRLHKYLVSLCRTGMLRQNEKGLYSVGATALQLAESHTGERNAINELNSVLVTFRDNFNHSTGVVVVSDNGLMLKHYNRSFRNVDIDYLPNTLVPLHASAAGQVFMSFSGYKAQNQAQNELIEQIKSQGYAVRYNPTKGIPGAQSIACPLRNSKGELIAIAVTMGFFTKEAIPQIASQLLSSVASLHPQG
ncbi:TPA: helix-turn-helix domain-containing protein [Citrobacter youngae]|uniref:IclR family transcriptional regulator n=1 Tax=Citrobacter TaxID=544 RepID=UPI0010CA128B|nr:MULTISPECIES: helix-turn-helix domain-containing protein [unclassified Citrobacter]TKU06372.1 IclR family transcriptional regulator [Citrobacter sp. wls828]HEE0141862.1 helix-turn-helix domain-containing protein [Citrobacter youngae]MBJ9202074.1 helix-turn-helix domain-containing protein [Citrobacter sp. FDAARGOS_156]MBJ9556704.1 helix-turn-helix domain-containing protein [Citrobacter sp. FDAARGOS_156]TKU38595.1 IclR family transcriptional regulator [Citrobacter sp. wls716]